MHNTRVIEDETPRAAAQADAQKERHEEYVQKDMPAPLMHGSTRRTIERAQVACPSCRQRKYKKTTPP